MMAADRRSIAAQTDQIGVFAVILATVICVSIVVGLLVARGGPVVAVALVALPIAAWLAIAHPGLAIGALWLIALNGIPLVDIRSSGGQLTPTDISVLAIGYVGVVQWLISPRHRGLRSLPSGIAIASLLFGAWWLITFVRSMNTGIPATDAFFFSRDFLYLIIVIPFAWMGLSTPKARRECALLIMAGAGAYGFAYVFGALGLVNATSFTHPQQIRTTAGIERLYTPMNDLVVTIAIFGIAALATTRRNRATPLITALTAVMLLAFFLQLTRAAYLGMAVGVLIGVIIALTRGPAVRRMLVRRLSIFLAALCIVSFAVIGLGSANSPTAVIGQRISSGFSQVDESSGTVGYRVNLYHEMLEVLGPYWPAGLGFLHPRDRYFPSLPDGDIRNTDVGLLNAVMTMGVVGLALLFGILMAFGRYMSRTSSSRPTWLIVGFFGWLALLVASSPTLVTLFGPTGLISTALTLVLCATTYDQRQRPGIADKG